MRILLLGEYSNVHATLAKGLKALGHEVVLASDGDGWKNYARDVDFSRGRGFLEKIKFLFRLLINFYHFRKFDVVQLINPIFLEIKAARIYPFYRFLRKHNRKVFLCALGIDYFWMKVGSNGHTFRYSDFCIGEQPRKYPGLEAQQQDWLNGKKGILNRFIASDCDGIIAGLYEYYESYKFYFPKKTTFIPLPIECSSQHRESSHSKIRFFIGIQKMRNEYKGTDIMLKALQIVHAKRPEECEIVKVESVPFEQYRKMLDSSDVLLDQLYGYTPGMNALLAMEKGIVVVGGGEPENYQILHEKNLKPIVNVEPNLQNVIAQLNWLLDHKSQLEKLSVESQLYVQKHHDYRNVAKQYLEFWMHGA